MNVAEAQSSVVESKPVSQEEVDLIQRAQAGDCSAFDTLCLGHGDRLLRQAIRICPDVAHAEDLVQETLIAAWRSLDRFDGSCRFSTWLCGILFNRARSLYRRHWWRDAARFLPFVGTHHATLETSVESPLPIDDTEFADQIPQLMKNLARLSTKHREVVELRFFAGESLVDIAAATGNSLGTVKSRLHYALERLRRMNRL